MQRSQPVSDVIPRINLRQAIRMPGHETNGDQLQIGEAIPVDIPQHLPVDELACLQRHVVVAQYHRYPADGGRDCGEQFRETVARSVDKRDFVAHRVEQVGEYAYPQRPQVTAFEDLEGIDDLVGICSETVERNALEME